MQGMGRQSGAVACAAGGSRCPQVHYGMGRQRGEVACAAEGSMNLATAPHGPPHCMHQLARPRVSLHSPGSALRHSWSGLASTRRLRRPPRPSTHHRLRRGPRGSIRRIRARRLLPPAPQLARIVPYTPTPSPCPACIIPLPPPWPAPSATQTALATPTWFLSFGRLYILGLHLALLALLALLLIQASATMVFDSKPCPSATSPGWSTGGGGGSASPFAAVVASGVLPLDNK